jgi:hypothetical protein
MILWTIAWLALIFWGVRAVVGFWKDTTRLDLFLLILTSLSTGVLPQTVGFLLGKTVHFNLKGDVLDLVMHLVTTLSACFTLILWAIPLFVFAMRRGGTPFSVIILLLLYPLVPAVFGLWGATHPVEFLGEQSYVDQHYVWWVWPFKVIAAPLTLARVVVTMLVFTVPLARDGVKDSAPKPSDSY